WNAKSQSIREIAKELQLGLDSFIFIDDNPVECAEMRAQCPEVLTIHLPPPHEIENFLKHFWAFDHVRVTEEDKQRTRIYQQNVEREKLRGQSQDFQDFLSKLDLKISIDKPTNAQISRVAELTQRTNQFNTSGIRRSEAEIADILRSSEMECWVT